MRFLLTSAGIKNLSIHDASTCWTNRLPSPAPSAYPLQPAVWFTIRRRAEAVVQARKLRKARVVGSRTFRRHPDRPGRQ